MKIILVAGARPNFMKIAPIIKKLKAHSSKLIANKNLAYVLVHTGQHYDYEMSQAFFDDLEISKPDYFLEAGSGSHAEQTARIMTAFEKVCERERPDVRSQRSGARRQRSGKDQEYTDCFSCSPQDSQNAETL